MCEGRNRDLVEYLAGERRKGSVFLAALRRWWRVDDRLREATRMQLDRISASACDDASAEAPAGLPAYRPRKTRSSAEIGWAITRSGTSQTMRRGGASRNVAPVK